MSRIRSDEIRYSCQGHGFEFAEKCTGHTVSVESCLSSDTITIYMDGKVTLVMDDPNYSALEKAMASLAEKMRSV